MERVLGTMNFGARTAPDEARRVMARAFERGVRRFDTANAYADGASERLVGELARAHPELEITTKVGIGKLRGPAEGLSPAVIEAALGASLARLGLPRVHRLYLHQPDPKTPIAATLDAIARELAAGRVGAAGVSNYAAWQTLELIERGLRPVAAQLLYNALVRDLEHEWLAFSAAKSVPVEVYNPLAGGLLAGRLAPGRPAPKGTRFADNPVYQRRYLTEPLFALAGRLAELAREAGLTPVALAYRWLLGRPIAAIVLGPADTAQLDEALDALDAGPLPAELHAAVDAAHRAYRGTDARYAR